MTLTRRPELALGSNEERGCVRSHREYQRSESSRTNTWDPHSVERGADQSLETPSKRQQNQGQVAAKDQVSQR